VWPQDDASAEVALKLVFKTGSTEKEHTAKIKIEDPKQYSSSVGDVEILYPEQVNATPGKIFKVTVR
jgi:hypothetical protein